MEREASHDWRYFGTGFVAVGVAILGIGAVVVMSHAPPRPSLWSSWYAIVAYLLLALGVVCGVAAAAGWSLPFGGASLGNARRAVLTWNPLVWRGFPGARQEATPSALADVQIATNYIKHVRDFMEGLRLSAIGLPPTDAVIRLTSLRDLLFDAIIQGVHSEPGEHIRCALFAPQQQDGVTVLRVRMHRGHTHRVEHLTLQMTSIAGIAYTSQRAEYVSDAENDPRVERTTAGRVVKTLYCLPLFKFGGVASGPPPGPIGVFSVASSRADAFTETDRAFISACADMIAVVEFFIGLWEAVRSIQAPNLAAAAGAPLAAPPPPAPPQLPPQEGG
jgi:hypothetical protein